MKSLFLALAMSVISPGDTITLSVDGDLSDDLKAILGDEVVDADGAVMTLAEGQTEIKFSLRNDSDITDDLTGAISASYEGTDPDNAQTAESNSWALNLKDAGEIDNTFNGDYLVKTETNHGAAINRYDLQGQLVEVVAHDKIYYVSDTSADNVADGADTTALWGNDYMDGEDGDDVLIGGGEAPSSKRRMRSETNFASLCIVSNKGGHMNKKSGHSLASAGAIYFVTGCVRKQAATGAFDYQDRHRKAPTRSSVRLAGHTGLGKRMDRTLVISQLVGKSV
ncbi:MAG: hypothetical protein HYX42_16625 [Polaromonas sp.]|uniref:hypothetical protein n=1 Tax=Polaromonas sp. TaxID=1869339 RepID=UPI0025DD4CE3|nr:hypothetical protein [Polaromonas sp.]MBI2727869.1 hypothetical protein [Polaromonas sp.]